MPLWPDYADNLPVPRDDEPSSLRQDIADELADHLNSAFNRELHLTRDETTAKEKVLDRFGDPRKIARKLWLDAMQEKLMSQRMTFVALLVVLLASFASMGLTWFLIDQSRQINQTMLEQSREANAALLQQSQQLLSQSHDSNRVLVEEGRKANEALLSKLGQLSTGSRESAEPPKSLEWNPVKVRLYTGEKPGDPAVGFQVRLYGHVLDTAKEVAITRKSDDKGMVDLGLVRPGQHRLSIRAPWDESRDETRITVLPGQSLVEEIACPAGPLRQADVGFAVEWPDEFKDKGYCIVAHFVPEPRVFDGQAWNVAPVENERVVVIGAGGKMISFSLSSAGDYNRGPRPDRVDWPFLPEMFGRGSSNGQRQSGLLSLGNKQLFGMRVIPKEFGGDGLTPRRVAIGQLTEYGFIVPESAPVSQLPCHATTYRMATILVTGSQVDYTPPGNPGFPRGTAKPDGGGQKTTLNLLPVLGGLVNTYGRPQQAGFTPETFFTLSDWVDTTAADGRPIDSRTRDEQRRKLQPTFVAKPEAINHWIIELPARLLDRVRTNPTLHPEEAEAPAPAAGAPASAPTNGE